MASRPRAHGNFEKELRVYEGPDPESRSLFPQPVGLEYESSETTRITPGHDSG